MALNDSDLPKLVELLNLIDIRFKVRRRASATWTASNEVLLDGEWGKETDTDKFKTGDGVTAWNDLPYVSTGGDGAPSVQIIASAATVTPLAENDVVVVSAQAVALTIANPTGTPTEGQGFVLRVKDNGSTRAVSWGSKYRAVGGVLPTATAVGEWLYLPAAYNSTDDKWDVFFDREGSGGAGSAQVQSFTSTSTVTPVHDDDMIVISAQAAALTIANPTGVANWADAFVVAIKDNGTARAITWGSDYRHFESPVISGTVVGKWYYIPVVYNQIDAKWDIMQPSVQP